MDYICRNGRRLFFKERMATVKDLDFKLRFAELNARWKNQLSQEERDEYSARAKAAYDKFMEEHPELYLVRPSLLNFGF